ncbi:DUF86 domain-containing protein [Cellulomonas sp. HZM]|uniref:HepT-like ribonuclease domain-containing protein n=1 Tax=Cellulomonas sp. HZM TaxID=1454010 RepID=UPI00068B90FA|nr:HepT-like ribonuclease domain-containing protein [Cellulomonas sp. HZM]
MSARPQSAWLADIIEAVDAIRAAELAIDMTGEGIDCDALAGIVADALTYRVMTIGEAVKHLAPALTNARPDVPWSSIARMRDLVTHHYHRRDLTVIRATVDGHLESLRSAVVELLELELGRES